jgi:uridine phosphorylase
VHAAKELGQPMHVGPIVSSDVFYNPDGDQYQRWSDRGILAVEMEAAMLFTLGALTLGCFRTHAYSRPLLARTAWCRSRIRSVFWPTQCT